ncbi:alginate lyase family protein [Vibrio ziniensis]|uniref:Alginate lyase family protein n=1 Tax=Vibrio ziniensis TaxID=2711221 RepID=A0A6G7CJ96_9VIBR|nr:alginate lyase family protein [Vibrio ziniensis]QIH42118.1 alginate lyase family protein [Vibrio ziniensis]QOT69926.1 alginate lyase [Vibrio ziniensis]
MFKRLALLCVLIFSFTVQSTVLENTLTPISYNIRVLENNKKNLQHLNQPFTTLIRRADKALTNPIDPVTNKTLMPASGDKHDYYSFGPYWWPNPDTPSGLPYIRKDGEFNLETRTSATDMQRLITFANNVKLLGLAYYFSDDQKYADKAIEQLRAWFINSQTKMNPNMNHAQAIPGRVNGRGIGIIDSRVLIGVVDAVELIKPTLSEKDYQSIVAWFREFNHWLVSSVNGIDEEKQNNNHGTWYDAQVVAFSLFTHQPDIAKQRLQITKAKRIANQFDQDGKQDAELARTRPWHYSNFNLQAYSLLGVYGEKLGVDIWSYQNNSIALENGYQYIAQYTISPERWSLKEFKKISPSISYSNMLYARHAYADPIFKKAVTKLNQSKENQSDIANLLF